MTNKFLFHITSKQNVDSILTNGLTRGNHAFICLCENPSNWKDLIKDSDRCLFSIDIKAFMLDFPCVDITTWFPQSDEICVWGDIPPKYISVSKNHLK